MVDPKPIVPILNTSDPLYTGLLVAHPMLDGIGTTVSDLSGNGYDGTATGGFTWFNDPELGVVLELNGTSGYVVLNAAINAVMDIQTGATVTFWLKLRNATPVDPAKTGLLDLQDLNGVNTATKYPDTDGLGYFSTFRELSRFDGVNLGATDRATWHHLAITAFSGGTYRVYVNGVEVGNTANEFGIHATIAATLGRSSDNGGNYYLDGYIGDFRLWTRQLVAPEILTQFNDPWRLYLPPDSLGTLFPMISTSADLRHEPNSAVRDMGVMADMSLRPAEAVSELGPIADLDRYSAIASNLLVAQIDVGYNDPTAFPALTDERDPTRKPDTPVKFTSQFDTNMVVAIPFAEGTGTTAADYAGSAGGPHNATLIGAATWSPGGFLANDYTTALGLDPNGSYAEITRNAEHEPATSFTMAAWVLPSGTQGGRGVFVKQGPSTVAYFLGTSGAGTQWQFSITDDVDGQRNLIGGTLTGGARAHLVGTYDGSVMRLYVNGVEVNNIGNSGNIVHDITKNLIVGQNPGGTSFSGTIDDVRFWNGRVLDADEVFDLYGSEYGIYCNHALARSLVASVDLRHEPNSAVRDMSVMTDLRFTPNSAVSNMSVMADLERNSDVCCTFLAAQIDVSPPASNPAGMSILTVDPRNGSINGGTFVTIRGVRFQDITDVQFGGVSLTGLSTPNSSTITGTTGPHVPGFVDVTVFSASLGNVTLAEAFAYVPFFGTGSDLLLKGVQIDPSLVRTQYFTGESAPLAANTTLSFVLDDYPIDETAVELYVRRVGEKGGTLQRQGLIYQYSVDMPNRQIVWRDTASFALIATDEIIVRYLAQGAV